MNKFGQKSKSFSFTVPLLALSEVQPIITYGIWTAEGIAVDWMAKNIYWVDSWLGQIEVAFENFPDFGYVTIEFSFKYSYSSINTY